MMQDGFIDVTALAAGDHNGTYELRIAYFRLQIKKY